MARNPAIECRLAKAAKEKKTPSCANDQMLGVAFRDTSLFYQNPGHTRRAPKS
jgi:hypothetical protein